MAAAESKNKPIADIAAAESTSPNPTSRPLVGTRSLMTNDPMVVGTAPLTQTTAASGDKPTSSINHQAKMVVPLDSVTDKPTPSTKKTVEPVGPIEAPETVAELAAPIDDSEPDSLEDDDAKAASSKNEAKLSDDAIIKHRQALEMMIEKGTYAVPINASKRKHLHMLIMWLFTIFILLIALATIFYYYGSKLGLPTSLPFKK